jgi:hypothetical protein
VPARPYERWKVTDLESPAPQQTTPVRGGCLSTFLVLMLIFNGLIILLYGFFLLSGRALLPAAPPWALPALLLLGAVNLVSAVALWRWRRWGLYALVASSLVVLGVNLSLGQSIPLCFLGLLGPVILLLLIRPVWKTFV